MKKYRAIVLAAIAVGYAIAAVVFPDVLLPDPDGFTEIFDAIANALEGAPE